MTERLRILHVITVLRAAGAEQALARCVIALKREGCSPLVVCLAPEPPDRRDVVEQLTAAGVPIQYLYARGPADTLRTLRLLREAAAEFRPHLVHSWLFHANVMTALAVRDEHFAGGTRRVVAGLRFCERGWFRPWMVRRIVPRVSRFACVSRRLAAEAAAIYGLPWRRLVVTPNGVDVAALDAALREADDGPKNAPFDSEASPVFLLAGRFVADKGIAPLTRHADDLLHDFPRGQLVIIGEGPQRARIASAAARAQAADRIHLLPWQSLEPWFRRSDVLLLPSRREGMPNLLLTAMAAGLPAAAATISGVREVLAPANLRQQLAPPRDDAALVQLARDLASDVPTSKHSLGAGNRARILNRYTATAEHTRRQRLYHHLLGPLSPFTCNESP